MYIEVKEGNVVGEEFNLQNLITLSDGTIVSKPYLMSISELNALGILEVVYDSEPSEYEYIYHKDYTVGVDSVTATCYIEEVDVEELKTKKKQEVHSLRLEKFYTNITVTFPSGDAVIQFRDEFDRANLANVATACINMAPSAEVVYRTEDNVTQTLTAAEMLEIATNVLNTKQDIVTASWIHKDTIDALTTVQDVFNYDITTNWPE